MTPPSAPPPVATLVDAKVANSPPRPLLDGPSRVSTHPGELHGAQRRRLSSYNGEVVSYQRIGRGAGGLTGPLEDGDVFGISVARLGDLDGDGVGDLAVGAYKDDDGGSWCGAVYILFLNADGTVKGEQKISDTRAGLAAALDNSDFFGSSVAGLGDLDGDGVRSGGGRYGDDDGGSNRGAVYILFLNADGTVKGEQKISDTQGGLAAALDNDDYFGSRWPASATWTVTGWRSGGGRLGTTTAAATAVRSTSCSSTPTAPSRASRRSATLRRPRCGASQYDGFGDRWPASATWTVTGWEISRWAPMVTTTAAQPRRGLHPVPQRRRPVKGEQKISDTQALAAALAMATALAVGGRPGDVDGDGVGDLAVGSY